MDILVIVAIHSILVFAMGFVVGVKFGASACKGGE